MPTRRRCQLPSGTVPQRSRITIAVVVVAALAFLPSCAGSTQAAIRVNDHEMSRSEFNDLLTFFTDHEDELGLSFGAGRDGLVDLYATPDGGGAARTIALVVQDFVFRDVIDRLDGTVLPSDIDATVAQLQGYSPEVTDRLVKYLASDPAFQRIAGERGLDVQQLYTAAFADFDVELDPRYGSYDSGRYLPPGS